jgi:hypothetical protein
MITSEMLRKIVELSPAAFDAVLWECSEQVPFVTFLTSTGCTKYITLVDAPDDVNARALIFMMDAVENFGFRITLSQNSNAYHPMPGYFVYAGNALLTKDTTVEFEAEGETRIEAVTKVFLEVFNYCGHTQTTETVKSGHYTCTKLAD